MINFTSALAFHRSTPEQIKERATARKVAVILRGEEFRIQQSRMTLPSIMWTIRRRAA